MDEMRKWMKLRGVAFADDVPSVVILSVSFQRSDREALAAAELDAEEDELYSVTVVTEGGMFHGDLIVHHGETFMMTQSGAASRSFIWALRARGDTEPIRAGGASSTQAAIGQAVVAAAEVATPLH